MQAPGTKHQNYEDSMVLSQFGSDEAPHVDVIWNWNSPQSEHHKRRIKRPHVRQSPKLSVKRPHPTEHANAFNKLQEELKNLKDEVENNRAGSLVEATDAFGDSLDEELVLCSQQVEKEFLNTSEGDTAKKAQTEQICEDSFDVALKDFEEDFSFLNEETPEAVANESLSVQSCIVRKSCSTSSTDLPSSNVKTISPIKCSPEEIEMKRLQALSKLRAKKQKNVAVLGKSNR